MPTVPLLALSYVVGLGLAAWLGGPWWLAALLASLVVAALRLHVRPAPSMLACTAAVALAAAGHARLDAAEAARATLAPLDGVHRIIGRVEAEPRVIGSQARVALDVRSIDGTPAAGRLSMSTRVDPDRPLPRPGDLLTLDGAVERSPLRPDEVVAEYPAWRVTGHETPSLPVAAIEAMRAWSLANIERSFPEPHAALAAGVLIGEQGALPSALRDALRTTGTTHLVVVSGQNIAVVLGVTVALLSAVVPRRRAGLLALALLPGYVVLVGASAPVLRASAMAVGLAAATAAGRRTPAWAFLAYAVAAMLVVDPLLVRDLSFQLSAAATVGVLLIAPPLTEFAVAPLVERGTGRLLPALVEAALVAVAAAVAVLPVQAAAFGTLSLVQVPANAAVALVYEGTLAIAAVAALLGWLPPVAFVLREAGSVVPDAFITVVDAFARVPFASVPLQLASVAVMAWVAGIAALLWLLARRPTVPQRALSVRATPPARRIALAVVAGGLWFAALAPVDPLPSVTVLNVGQGLAVLVRDEGRSVLIDAGPADGAVLAALERAGQRKPLDMLVLTHDDIDHIGGAVEVTQRLGAREVLGAPHIPARNLGLQPIDIGDRIRLTARTSIEVLSPPAHVGPTTASDNDAGLVLLVRIGDRRVLIPADIEAGAEHRLVRSGQPLSADVIVVPHHGSRTSSTPEFLRAVAPGVAVVSVGARNAYGHPVAEVLARYAPTPLYRTDEVGDVTLRSDGARLWVHQAHDAEDARSTSRATVGPREQRR
ncbi:MAG: DNA internalization-related competence protein ComEC/Rec2 [Dehalococcoidia bacterium]